MALQLGATAPDFEVEIPEGRISFHDRLGDSHRSDCQSLPSASL